MVNKDYTFNKPKKTPATYRPMVEMARQTPSSWAISGKTRFDPGNIGPVKLSKNLHMPRLAGAAGIHDSLRSRQKKKVIDTT